MFAYKLNVKWADCCLLPHHVKMARLSINLVSLLGGLKHGIDGALEISLLGWISEIGSGFLKSLK